MSKSYWELLRDPRWQRKRLEVMQRDEFACRQCGDKTSTLNVHHTHYVKGRAPWEYENESLKTLCESCHSRISEITGSLKQLTGRLGLNTLEVLLGFVKGAVALTDESYFAGVRSVTANNVNEWEGVCKAVGISIADGSLRRVVEKAADGGGSVSVEWLVDLYVEQHDIIRKTFPNVDFSEFEDFPESQEPTGG